MSRGGEVSLGESVTARLDALAGFSEAPDRLTRRYLSEAHRKAAARVPAWMREPGMTAAIDPAGSVAGRCEGAAPGGPALLLGSHTGTRAIQEASAHRAGERLPLGSLRKTGEVVAPALHDLPSEGQTGITVRGRDLQTDPDAQKAKREGHARSEQ